MNRNIDVYIFVYIYSHACVCTFCAHACTCVYILIYLLILKIMQGKTIFLKWSPVRRGKNRVAGQESTLGPSDTLCL